MDLVVDFEAKVLSNGQHLSYRQIFPREGSYLEKMSICYDLVFFRTRYFRCFH